MLPESIAAKQCGKKITCKCNKLIRINVIIINMCIYKYVLTIVEAMLNVNDIYYTVQ